MKRFANSHKFINVFSNHVDKISFLFINCCAITDANQNPLTTTI